MTTLITVDSAISHLRIDRSIITSGNGLDTDEYAELVEKMEDATGVVLDYLKDRADEDWTTETVPRPVRAAILLILTALWDDRNGTGDGDYIKDDGAVANLLRRLRDPALA